MSKYLRNGSRIIVLVICLIICGLSASAQEPQSLPDSVGVSTDTVVKKMNIIQKVINYFEKSNKTTITRRPSFSFLGGPHYSNDTKLGLGLLAAGVYSTCPENTAIQPSNVSIFADITTAGYYKLGIRGLHLYRDATRRVDYEVSFKFYKTYFWGVGYDDAMNKENKTKYNLLDFMVLADHLWNVGGPVFLGPQIKFDRIATKDRSESPIWEGMAPHCTSLGVGLRMQFDTRDNYTAPNSGWFGEFTQRFYPRFLWNNNHSFSQTEFALNYYVSPWKKGVIASRIHGNFTYGRTPWCLMPSLGGSYTMRGYYEGQFRDKDEMDLTVELRQRVYRRSGIAVWGGLGTVFSSFKNIKARTLLPTYGVGYRWEFKKNTNVRIDLGFGKKTWGVEFNLNEAF